MPQKGSRSKANLLQVAGLKIQNQYAYKSEARNARRNKGRPEKNEEQGENQGAQRKVPELGVRGQCCELRTVLTTPKKGDVKPSLTKDPASLRRGG